MSDNDSHSHASLMTSKGTDSTDKKWMALSPIAVMYFAANTIKHIFGNIVYLTPAFIAGYSTLKDNPTFGFIAVFAFLSISLGYGALGFIFYRFRLNQASVEIRSGVLSKKHLNLPFNRIQNVKFEQPFYYRPFGYCCIELDTAGSSAKEAKIVALRLNEANQLKEHILNHSEIAETSQSEPNIPTDNGEATPIKVHQEKVLNQRSISDLVIHGLTSNRVWILVAALAPFYDNISSTFVSFVSRLGINIESFVDQSTTPTWQIIIFLITAMFLVVLAMTLLSIIGAIIMFYGFTLSKTRERYIQRSGLITKREVSMKISRIQIAIRKQDWLDNLLGRMNLTFEQKSQSSHQGDMATSMQQKLTIPSIKLSECQQLIDDAMPGNRMAELVYSPINNRFILHHIVFRLLPLFFPILGILLYSQQTELAGLGLIAGLITAGLIVLRKKRWGYHIDEHFLYVRKGLAGVSYYCVPLFKVQQAEYKQSAFMRRAELAHAKFVLASGVVNVPFIEQTDALGLIDKTLYKIESTQGSWM